MFVYHCLSFILVCYQNMPEAQKEREEGTLKCTVQDVAESACVFMCV